jgi:uncharacterized damage-inducible protein DinB
MIPALRSLFEHQAWADSVMFSAVRNHPAAAADEELRRTLHHIVVTQRAFLALFLKRPFDVAKELKTPDSLEALEAIYHETHADELAFVRQIEDGDLARTFELVWIPGARPTLAEALTQVVMHSQHHRGQCASRLRTLGGKPPMVDYIIWIKDRPAPAWSKHA